MLYYRTILSELEILDFWGIFRQTPAHFARFDADVAIFSFLSLSTYVDKLKTGDFGKNK